MNPDLLEYAPSEVAFDTDRVDFRAAADGNTGVFSEVQAEDVRSGVVFRLRPANWFQSVDRLITSLAALGRNWDSYGAAPIDPEAIMIARQVAHDLAMIDGVPQPVIGGTPDGEVGFAWDAGDWSLDLTVDASPCLHYVYLDRQDPRRETERHVRNLRELAFLLTQPPKR